MAKDDHWVDDRQKDVLHRGSLKGPPSQPGMPAKQSNTGSSLSGSLGVPYDPRSSAAEMKTIRESSAGLPLQTPVARKLTPEEADAIALIDSQTGVFNLRTVVRQLAFELERARYFNRTVTVLAISIDNYSVVGLEHGPIALDRLLEAATTVLVNAIRPFDLVGRHSEQILIVVCPEMDKGDVATLAQTICQVCGQLPVKYQWKEFNFTTSIGAAVSSEEAADPESLIALAVKRANAALAGGGNAVCLET